jgi:hypothetical protein
VALVVPELLVVLQVTCSTAVLQSQQNLPHHHELLLQDQMRQVRAVKAEGKSVCSAH